MWKILINKSIREVRFVLKGAKEHDGVWRFIEKRLGELAFLNQNTHFNLVEIKDGVMETDSAVHLVYGDLDDTQDEILSSGLSHADFEAILKTKIDYGLTLRRALPKNNDQRETPLEFVEARNTIKHMDDNFN